MQNVTLKQALDFFEVEPDLIQALDLVLNEHNLDINCREDWVYKAPNGMRAFSPMGVLAGMTEIVSEIDDPQLKDIVDRVTERTIPDRYRGIDIKSMCMLHDVVATLAEEVDLPLSYRTVSDHVNAWALTNEAMRAALNDADVQEKLDKWGDIYVPHVIEAMKLILQHRISADKNSAREYFLPFEDGIPEEESLKFMTVSLMAMPFIK